MYQRFLRMSRGARYRASLVPAGFAILLVITVASTTHAQDAALAFDGVDDVATIADPSGWEPYFTTTSLTVEAWVKPSDLSATEISGIVRGFDFTMGQRHYDHSSLSWTISVGSTDSAYTPTGSLVVGRWDHFAGTYDGKTMRIYQNGNLVAEKVHPVGGLVEIDGDVYIGLRPDASAYSGIIDEVRIWAVVRSAAQIKQWMDQPLTGSEPGLLGYWQFDEGTGQVIADSTPFGNNGTLGASTAVGADDPLWTVSDREIFSDGFEDGNTSVWSSTVGG